MIIPDINLLLYAYFSVFPFHQEARRWWEAIGERGEPVGLAPPVLFGFVRIATNRRVFVQPMDLQQATGIVEGWLVLPSMQVLRPGPRHVEVAFDLLRAAGTRRDLTTDAQIAAYALETGGVVHTADGDFSRFAGVVKIDPLAE
ncbi:MAG TPA: TA system VapC family ribonuclease toxin [Thermoanaerobaculia bacterium]|jgi:toxin-antitoxin system PIN domain toxin|nr:TA system VapC family ribonuclease toxin [Thermoanaerobaculia bacterium]